MPGNTEPTKMSRVVQLEPQSNNMKPAHLAKLPAAVSMVRDKYRLMMLQRLKVFFDKLDDSLFELADKAGSNQEQNNFFEAMREVRVCRRRIEKNILYAIEDAFFQLLGSTPQPENNPPAQLNIQRESLSLVENSELEESVATDTSIARAHREHAELIQLIGLRLDSLVPQKVYQKNNPLGPEVLCNAFMAEAKKLELECKAKLVLFKLFDKLVVSQLGQLYEVANQVFIDNNILPNLSIRDAQGQAQAQGQGQAQSSSVPTGSSSGKTHASQARQGCEVSKGSEVLKALEEVLGGELVQSSPNQGVSQLLGYLSQRQKQLNATPGELVLVDIKSLMEQISLEQGGRFAGLQRMDREVIHLVNMLFEFILRDENLSEPMKVLLARLQIPLIKVGLMDKTFFAKDGHAARRLLNDMAKAALGWNPDTGKGKACPLYRKMEEVVNRLTGEFEIDLSLFTTLLEDFNRFLKKEKQRAALLEKRMLDAEGGKARAEEARTVVAAEIERRLQYQELPTVVQTMICEAWRQVLFVVGLKHGFKSSEWHSALRTLDDLMWSVRAPQNAEHRRQLIRLVPDLIHRLSEGMDMVSYNPFVMADWFKALEQVHLQLIRQKPEAAEPAPAAKQAEAKANPGVKAELNAEPSHSEAPSVTPPPPSAYMAPSEAAALNQHNAEALTPYLQQVADFVQGAWFEMLDDQGVASRCRLAAVIRPSGKYIFVSRNGMKVAEKTQQELANALKLQKLRALDDGMLFDRALETVVSSLRKAH